MWSGPSSTIIDRRVRWGEIIARRDEIIGRWIEEIDSKLIVVTKVNFFLMDQSFILGLNSMLVNFIYWIVTNTIEKLCTYILQLSSFL
jgi:hypothetical protein